MTDMVSVVVIVIILSWPQTTKPQANQSKHCLPSACCKRAAEHVPLQSRRQQELEQVVAAWEGEVEESEIEIMSKAEGRAKAMIARG
jgi:hypothetical protein